MHKDTKTIEEQTTLISFVAHGKFDLRQKRKYRNIILPILNITNTSFSIKSIHKTLVNGDRRNSNDTHSTSDCSYSVFI